jgi:hypothetical protein
VCSAHFGALRVRQAAGIHVRSEIVSRQFVRSFEAFLEVGREFVGAQSGAFLNAHPVGKKQRQVGSDDKVPGGLALLDYIKPVRSGVPLLLKSQVPDFHSAPLRSGQPRARQPLIACRKLVATP